jgi:hypothetical protein
MFLIVRYHSIVKQYPIEKIFTFSKSLTLKNDDVQSITLCEYVHIYLFTNWTCNVWWFHSPSSFFFPHTYMKYEKGIESNRFIVTLPFSFSISSHPYSIQFISNDLMRSFRNGAILYIEILFNHARDCDRAERNNRWNSSYKRTIVTYRQFVTVHDLWVLTHERRRRKKRRQTDRQADRHIAIAATITAVFRHLMMNIRTKPDGYIIYLHRNHIRLTDWSIQ